MTIDDINHLQWLRDRLVYKYKEDPNVDYIIKFDYILYNLNEKKAIADVVGNKQLIGQCPKCNMSLPQCICKQSNNYMKVEEYSAWWDSLTTMRNYFTFVNILDKNIIISHIDNMIKHGYRITNISEIKEKVETSFIDIKPHICPVCGGNGLVPNGFYMQTSGNWSTTDVTPEQCRSCEGSGIVWHKEYSIK